MIKRRLTRESLTELAKRMPVLSEETQRSYVGGGDGTFSNPYSYQEYLQLNNPCQVYYLDESGNLTYALSESVVTAYRGTEYKIAGGTLIDTQDGVVFISDSGLVVTFEGVDISTSMVREGTAYQYNGTIHSREEGLGLDNFIHEYGHYLQQQEMSGLGYAWEAVKSGLSILFDRKNHHDRSFEQDATQRGQEYWNNQLNKQNK